ncbi:MAG: anti-sigma factor family protein, partial [Actinomycetota bacterium]
MTCEELRDNLDRYIDGELDERTRRRVEEHLPECPACARELKALQQLALATAGVMPKVAAPNGFDAAVLSRLPVRRFGISIPPWLTWS